MITENDAIGVSGVSKRVAQAARNGAAMSAQKRAERGSVANHVATSEKEYSGEEMTFLAAIEGYKLRTGRKYPSWSEVLSVVKEVGYVMPL